MTAVGIGLFLTLTGCAEYGYDFPGASKHNDGLVFSSDGTLLAPKAGPNPKVWDTKTRKILWEIDRGKDGRVDSVAFSPDGKTLASGDMGGTIKLRAAKTGGLLWADRHNGRVYALAFSPDGKFLVSGVVDRGHADKPLKLWDAATGELLRTLGEHDDFVHFVGFSPDGKTLVSMGNKNRVGTIQLWDVETWMPLRTRGGHSEYITSVTFSPDGKVIASGSWDTTVKLWDVRTGALIRTLRGHGGKVWQVVFSPDGKTLVSSSDDATIKVWDAKTGALIRTLTEHSERVMSVAFSPDGKLLASGSDDATVRLWNAETGKFLQHIKGNEHRKHPYAHLRAVLADAYEHHYAVRAVAFSPDGKALASASVDPIVNLWNVETAAE